MEAGNGELAAGRVLDQSYELLEAIGSGGMGTVWRAQHRRLPKEVAVKVLRATVYADDARARFRREAEIISRLGHPHIVEALDFNILADGTSYLVLELLRGQSLRDRLRLGPLPVYEVATITRQVASALAAAHEQGVVHRDLKPENIFLCEHQGERGVFAKILDFGISKLLGETHLTQKGMIFGTPQYMAPEQAEGRPADGRSDQYALGIIVFEMIVGVAPFNGERPLDILAQVVHKSAPRLDRVRPEIPCAFADAVAQAVMKLPEERYPSVTAFSRDLSGAAGVPTGEDQLLCSSGMTPLLCSSGLTPVPHFAPFHDSAAGEAPTVPPAVDFGQGNPGVLGFQATVPSPIPERIASTPSTRVDRPGRVTPSAIDDSIPTPRPPVEPADVAPPPPPRRRAWFWLTSVIVAVALAAGVLFVMWRGAKRGVSRVLTTAVSVDDLGIHSTYSDGARAARGFARGADDAPRPAIQRDGAPVERDVGGPRDTQAAAPEAARDARRRVLPAYRPRPDETTVTLLPAEARTLLEQGDRALRQGDASQARYAGEHLLMQLPARERWRAHRILAMAYCMQRDLALAKLHYGKLAAPARHPVARFCRAHLPLD